MDIKQQYHTCGIRFLPDTGTNIWSPVAGTRMLSIAFIESVVCLQEIYSLDYNIDNGIIILEIVMPESFLHCIVKYKKNCGWKLPQWPYEV